MFKGRNHFLKPWIDCRAGQRALQKMVFLAAYTLPELADMISVVIPSNLALAVGFAPVGCHISFFVPPFKPLPVAFAETMRWRDSHNTATGHGSENHV